MKNLENLKKFKLENSEMLLTKGGSRQLVSFTGVDYSYEYSTTIFNGKADKVDMRAYDVCIEH